MKKIKEVKQLTFNKFLNMFEVTYETGGLDLKYFVASRKSLKELSCLGNKNVDAVRIIPYFYSNQEWHVVLIKEFRYAINDYIYAVPAGLVDPGESLQEAALRELKEEIGASVSKIQMTSRPAYSSAGMSDESIACFEAYVTNLGKQSLDFGEEISLKVVSLKELEKMLQTEHFGMQSSLQLQAFVYKKRLEKYEEIK